MAGIYTTDPRVVPNAQRIDTMSFAEAAEMATFGGESITPLRHCFLPFVVISLFM